MAAISTSTIDANGLPLALVSLPGTRAATLLVAFDAGARNERLEENGMAHFLEHLVFKGGQSYPTYRDVNETAERLGGVLNAYTSQDLVAFHITVRAEAVEQALDLLTDFVGRPRLDAEELERERGVVIQEINRAYDQPAVVAEYLIDKAAFGEHPMGRTVLGPAENLRSFSREAIVEFRERCWSGSRGGAFIAGNLDRLPDEGRLQELFGRFPALPAAGDPEPVGSFEPRVLVEPRETNQSHLRMIYRPAIDVTDRRQRAALTIYATLLGGSMGSRLFDEIRERRGLCYSVSAASIVARDTAVLQLSSGLDSAKCIEAYERMRGIVDELRSDGPNEAELERARAYAAGSRVLAFENSRAVASNAARQRIVHGASIDPDVAISELDEVTFEQVRDVAAGVSEELAVACVGPHDSADF
ncbi:MAG TPA: pitrilysin family protein [Solirubrobacteraceae bacterium]|nr:pitrilysin family protein [Solirubrobacteraceae bacterium]